MNRRFITILFVVFLSAMLWVYVTFSGEHNYNFHFPIQFTEVPEGYAISNVSDKEIVVGLRGIGWDLAKMTFGRNQKFKIPVQDKGGSQSVVLRNAVDENSWISTAVEVNEISPANVYFRLEKVKTKVVPVKSNAELDFDDGYGLVSPVEVIPDTVKISGPESIINSIDTVLTENKVFSNLDEGGYYDIDLARTDYVSYRSSRARMHFDVQKIVDKEFGGIEIEIRNIPPSKDLTLIPSKISVVLRGGISNLGKLSEDDIKAHIKFSQALKDTLGYVVPTIDLPEYMELIDIKPRRIEYIIQQY